jgi:flagellin
VLTPTPRPTSRSLPKTAPATSLLRCPGCCHGGHRPGFAGLGQRLSLGGATALFGAATVTSAKTTISQTDVTDATKAQNALAVIDKAIGSIDSVRSGLGATQNRLTTTVDNLQNIQKNSTAARSTVQDVDFASETAELTKQQTLQQASTAILSQANQLPSSVLKLLQ